MLGGLGELDREFCRATEISEGELKRGGGFCSPGGVIFRLGRGDVLDPLIALASFPAVSIEDSKLCLSSAGGNKWLCELPRERRRSGGGSLLSCCDGGGDTESKGSGSLCSSRLSSGASCNV